MNSPYAYMIKSFYIVWKMMHLYQQLSYENGQFKVGDRVCIIQMILECTATAWIA